MDDYIEMDGHDIHIDAIAIVAASARGDSHTVGALLAAMDYDAMVQVVMVLALMVQSAVLTQGMSVDEFLGTLAQAVARKSMEDPQ